MNYHWDWGVFWHPTLDGSGNYLDSLLIGLQWTVVTSLCAWVIALVIGSVLGVFRTTRSSLLAGVANVYIELFRNVPLLMQLFLWYFVMPEMLPQAWGDWVKQLPNGSVYTAILGLGLYMAPRVAIQLSAGVGALPRGQRMAAQAMGLTTVQTYRYVLLPMAFRIIFPPLTSEFLNTIKNSSVAITVGLLELTARARAMQEETFQVFEAFIAAAVLYLALNFIVTFAMRWIERRLAVPGYISGR
ncbi:MAG TPA: amino acid ABC transporter permease [Bordetella sp.]